MIQYQQNEIIRSLLTGAGNTHPSTKKSSSFQKIWFMKSKLDDQWKDVSLNTVYQETQQST